MDGYIHIGKVINRSQLEKLMTFSKLKYRNSGFDCELEDVFFEYKHEKLNTFDENNDTVISLVDRYINLKKGPEEPKKRDNDDLWHIYGSNDYLLIPNDVTEILPSITFLPIKYESNNFSKFFECC
jgi:hypothetical protein